MRRLSAAAMATVIILAGSTAQASYTIDLIWADSGTPTLTLSPGEKNATSAGTPCRNAPVVAGRCLTVQFTAEEPWVASVSRLAWDEESSGLGIAHSPRRSAGPGSIPDFFPISPKLRDPSTCPLLPCDTIVGSFGGVVTTPSGRIPAGVFVIGSIHLDASALLPGKHVVQHFVRQGVGGVVDGEFKEAAFQINGATIVLGIPEPGSALLYVAGLALFAGALRGRRSTNE